MLRNKVFLSGLLKKIKEESLKTTNGDFLGGPVVKNLPAMQKTWVQALGWEDPLEKGTANHSSILTWKTPWAEEPGKLQSMRSQRVLYD